MLTKRTQVLVKVQTHPDEEVTSGFSGADVIEVLNASFGQTRSLIDRTPASGSLSNPKKAVGVGEATESFEVDLRAGASSEVPDFDKFLLACGLRQKVGTTLTVGAGLSEAVDAGDVIEGQISKARAIVFKRAEAAGTSLDVMVLTDDTAAFGTEALDNLTKSTTGIGNVTADANTANVVCYQPISRHRFDMDMASGTWGGGGTPSAGMSVVFAPSSTSAPTAGGVIVEISGADLTIELIWGRVAANDLIVASNGGTNSVHASPNFSQDQWPYITVRENRSNLVRALANSCGNVQIKGEAGSSLMATFSFLGKKGTHDDGALIPPTTRNTKLACRMLKTGSSEFTLNGALFPWESFEFDAGVGTVLRPNANATEGVDRTEGTERNPRLTITMSQVPNSSYPFDTNWESGTTARVRIASVGSGARNAFVLVAPQAQLAEVSDGENSGLANQQFTYELAAQIEDDEFALRFGDLP